MAGMIVDGESGYVIERDDVAALADLLMCLAADRDLRRSMGAAERRLAELLYDGRLNAASVVDAVIAADDRWAVR